MDKPITREEQLYKAIIDGEDTELEPITRREKYLKRIANNMVKSEGLTPHQLENINKIDDFARVETVNIVNGQLQLTESLTQYCIMEDLTEIILPTTDKQRLQIHLNFIANGGYTLLLPPVWTQGTIEIEEGKFHELIFEKVLNTWKCGVVKYGQEVTF